MQRHPPFQFEARVEGLYRTAAAGGFETAAVERLPFGFEGPPGRHAGLTRLSGPREPWYPRGTPMRNERQVTIVAADELAAVAAALAVPEVRPEWLGATMTLAGVPDLTALPPRTGLFFDGGATLHVDGINRPCRLAGRAIQARHPGRDDIQFAFVRAARYLRGIVAWVEKPGEIAVGEGVRVRVPEQWVYADRIAPRLPFDGI